MECLLCTMWARMPYGKRYTTPTSAQETEGAMILGYWTASRSESVPRLCERHMHILENLDGQENQRLEAERASHELAQRTAQQQERFIQQTSQLHQRRQLILEASRAEVPVVVAPLPVIPVFPTIVEPPKPPDEFRLGPGPLANENIITAPPPMPVEADPAQAYRAKPGTMEAALEMTKLPPVEGAKVSYPCPSCGKEIVTGDIHAC